MDLASLGLLGWLALPNMDSLNEVGQQNMRIVITAFLAILLGACALPQEIMLADSDPSVPIPGKLIRCDGDASTWHDCYTASLRHCADYYIAEHEHIVADGNVTFENLYIRCK